jgi:hypothetical protein
MAAAAVETSLSINVGELVARLDRVRPSRFETGAPHPPVDVGQGTLLDRSANEMAATGIKRRHHPTAV